MKRGTTFVNHRINSCVCTPSRSVIYTGRHIQQTRMFDNTNFPWIDSLSTDVPTLGDLLRAAGYYTAYKGKWHLTKEFETVNKLGSPTKIFTEEMEAYGFSDYFGVGDIIAHDRGGFLHDGIIAAMGVSWLRGKGRDLAAEGKPWFLAVNLVNPHDVMFYDTDAPGTPVQSKRGLARIARDPVDPLYAKQWDFKLPASHAQAIDAPGRPPAHRDFLRSHDALVGEIPDEAPRWRRRHNYYLNCLRDVDRNIGTVLAELEASGLADQHHHRAHRRPRRHGRRAQAARQGRGRLPRAEQRAAGDRAPGVSRRPAMPRGDLARRPGADAAVADRHRRSSAPGHRQGPARQGLVRAAGSTGARRRGCGARWRALLLQHARLPGRRLPIQGGRAPEPGGKPAELKAAGTVADLRKRGAVRSVYDGRYVFARYFSPKQHNRPTTLEDLVRLNDVELYDTRADPHEMTNLAAPAVRNRELLLAMNDKLNRLIDAEVGEDRGQMLPGGIDAGWEVTPETMAGA